MLISEYFANKQIFITGGSGFIGKALIEKLLRSCPNIDSIFVLLRSKRQFNAEQRLEQVLQTSLFNRVRKEQPLALQKVRAIAGDCEQLGLGISAQDLHKLQNVNIIFHAAANVRFDDALRDAVLLNMRGTHELIKIALNLQQLQAFMHVSTTYCNPDQHTVEEKVYSAKTDWRQTINLAEHCSQDTLNYFSAKYCNHEPNTYTFTKGLTEQIVKEYSDRLPTIIFRPSIVMPTLHEPVPGWIDNFNGPMGLLMACGLGIMHTCYSNPNTQVDIIPNDTVVRALIVAAYKRGMDSISKQLEVINCSLGASSLFTNDIMIQTGKRLVRDNPFEQTIWLPSGSMTHCIFWHYLRYIFKQMAIAVLVDSLLYLSKQKTRLLKVQRRISAACHAVYLFLNTTWIFKNDHLLKLNSMVPATETSTFEFINYSKMDFDSFCIKSIRGMKEFLLNEPPEATEKARIRFTFLKYLHDSLSFIGIFCILYFVFNYFSHKLAVGSNKLNSF